MVKHFGIKKMAALVMVVFAMAVLAGCGGGSSNAVVNEQVPLSGSNTVIAESVKVEKTGDTVTVNYQTSSPVKKAYVVTSDFAFNNAPLWSEFNEVKTEDGLTVVEFAQPVLLKTGQTLSLK